MRTCLVDRHVKRKMDNLSIRWFFPEKNVELTIIFQKEKTQQHHTPKQQHHA
jgi:hypothetical protein